MRLGVLALVVILGLLVSRGLRQVADTAGYDWGAHDSLGPTLRRQRAPGLQVGPLPWGLLVVMVLGLSSVCAGSGFAGSS